MTSPVSSRVNISSDLCQLIRREVVDGTLPPGERINEVHLSGRLEVSRTPLREALSRLVAEGLIESVPRRGFFTRELSVEEVRQLYPLRALLDPHALHLVGIPDRHCIAELRQLNDQIANVRRPNVAVDLDNQWHRRLLLECPNQLLLEMIEQLIWKTRRYEYAYLAETRNLQVATEEHEAIAVALERSDLSSACALLAKNMASTTEPLVAWLESREQDR